MTKIIYAALLVLFLVPMAFAETPQVEAPAADVQNADAPEEAEAPAAETSEAETPAADVKSADAPEVANPECEEILAQFKEAKAVHDVDYKAKGKAYYNWRKYNKELHSMSYEGTDEPLADSAEKCEKGDYLGKDFCKGALKKYNEISAKEKPAKEQLDAAEAISNESRKNYNVLLQQAFEMNCLVKK